MVTSNQNLAYTQRQGSNPWSDLGDIVIMKRLYGVYLNVLFVLITTGWLQAAVVHTRILLMTRRPNL